MHKTLFRGLQDSVFWQALSFTVFCYTKPPVYETRYITTNINSAQDIVFDTLQNIISSHNNQSRNSMRKLVVKDIHYNSLKKH